MRRTSTFLAAACAILIASAGGADARSDIRVHAVKEKFDSVKQDVVDAIVNRGLVIDYTAHVGAMLARTAKDVGATKVIYADAQTVQFCSATLSRRKMEADPANVAFCPYVIFIYALADSPETTHVGYRPLPRRGSRQSKAAIVAVNALLDAIVREAAGKK